MTRTLYIAPLALALACCSTRSQFMYGVDDVIDSVAVGDHALLVTNDYRVAVWQNGTLHTLPPPFAGPYQPAPTATWVASHEDAIVVGESVAEWDGIAWTYTSLPQGAGRFSSALRCDGRTWALQTGAAAGTSDRLLELQRGEALVVEAPGARMHALHCHANRLIVETTDDLFALRSEGWLALEEPRSDGELLRAPGGRIVVVSTIEPGLFDEVPPRGASEVVLESWDDGGRIVRERVPLPSGHEWSSPVDVDLAFEYANASVLPGPEGEFWLFVTDVYVGEDYCATMSRPVVCGSGGPQGSGEGEPRTYEEATSLYHWDGAWTQVAPDRLPLRGVVAGDGTLWVLDGWEVIVATTISRP